MSDFPELPNAGALVDDVRALLDAEPVPVSGAYVAGYASHVARVARERRHAEAMERMRAENAQRTRNLRAVLAYMLSSPPERVDYGLIATPELSLSTRITLAADEDPDVVRVYAWRVCDRCDTFDDEPCYPSNGWGLDSPQPQAIEELGDLLHVHAAWTCASCLRVDREYNPSASDRLVAALVDLLRERGWQLRKVGGQ